MITYKYVNKNKSYVFAKDGMYWALTPDQLLEMHKLTGDLVPDALQRTCEQSLKDKKTNNA